MDQQSKVTWNPYTKGYFDNPYEHLRECRDENPIQKIMNGSRIFFRYRDVSKILSSNNFSVSQLSEFFKEKESYIFKNSSACPYLHKGTKMWTMYLNGEAHKNSRAVMGKSLNIKNLEKALVKSIAETNEKYKGKKEFNLISYCEHFIFLVVKEILGIGSFSDLDKIRTYSNMLARSQDIFIPKQVYQEINEWLLWGKEIFVDSEYRENIIRHSKDLGITYSEEEIYSIMSLTLMAAFETSKDNLSLALMEILKDERLKGYVNDCNSTELNLLIEELFRYSSPLQYTIRINNDDLDYEGLHIPKNTRFYLCLASSNRDPDFFEAPDTIIPDRKPNDHISFGKGVHFCLGATIARQEMRYCLKPMVDFLKNMRIKENESIEWGKQIFMRTAHSIMIEQNN